MNFKDEVMCQYAKKTRWSWSFRGTGQLTLFGITSTTKLEEIQQDQHKQNGGFELMVPWGGNYDVFVSTYFQFDDLLKLITAKKNQRS